MNDPQIKSIVSVLPPYQGKQRLITRRQDTFDIIRSILKRHEQCAAHYDRISSPFWKGSARDTARELFSFMKQKVGYVVEPTTSQSTKSPAAILIEGKQYGGDCKHYASFIVGIAESLRRKGYPIKAHYRFASYDAKKNNPGHVFAIVEGPENIEYWTDPVLSHFDQRTPAPTSFIDKIPEPMNNKIGELYEISGVIQRSPIKRGTEYLQVPKAHWLDTHFTRQQPAQKPPQDNSVNGPRRGGGGRHHARHHGGRFHHHGGRGIFYNPVPVPVYSPEVVELNPYPDDTEPLYNQEGERVNGDDMGKAKKKKDPKNRKKLQLKIKPGKLLKKFGGAAPRNAFLALTKLNFMSLGTKMNTAIKDPAKKKKLWDWWTKLGGNTNKLSTAIHNGVATYNKLHKKKTPIAMNGAEVDAYMNGMGADEYEDTPFFLSGTGDYTSSDYETMGFIPEEMRQTDSVGFAPAAIPALLAAAAPIIAAAKSLLKSFGIDTENLSRKADTADSDVVSMHNQAGDEYVSADGSVDHGGGVTTRVSSGSGGQTMQMEVNDPGDDVPGGADPAVKRETGLEKYAASSAAAGPGLKEYIAQSWDWIKEHKMYFIGIGGLIATILIIKAVRNRKPGKKK